MWYLLYLFVFITQFARMYAIDGTCSSFKMDSFHNINFVTLAIGTPVVNYRLMICVNPKASENYVYSTILLKDSFGGGKAFSLNYDLNGLTTGTNTLPGNFVTKSVSFEEIYEDEVSIIGRDLLRSTEGNWLEIGIEIPLHANDQSVIDSICNPGGVGDPWYSIISSKYNRFDGYFLISKGTKFIVDQNSNSGHSAFSLVMPSIFRVCYFDSGVKIEKFIQKNAGKFSFYGEIKEEVTNPTQYTSYDNMLDFVFDKNFMDIPVKLQVNEQQSVVKNTTTQNSTSFKILYNTYNNYEINFRKRTHINTGIIESFYKRINNAKTFNQNKLQYSKQNKKRSKGVHSDVLNNAPTGYQVKFLLNQPYNYLPNELYHGYMENKNLVLDIPDEQWETICLTKKNSKQRDFCLGTNSIVKTEFLTKKKDGHVMYFPSSSSKSGISSGHSSFVVGMTTRGGRSFGNTLAQSDINNMLTTDHAKAKAADVFLLNQDKYFLNSMYSDWNMSGNPKGNGVHVEDYYLFSQNENSHLYSEIHTNSKLNRMLLLPHNGNSNTVYLGSSAIMENSIEVHFLVNHSDGNMRIATLSAMGFERAFLIANTDVDEGSTMFYLLLNIFFCVIFIIHVFKLRSICVKHLFKLFHDVDVSKVRTKYGFLAVFVKEIWIGDLFLQLFSVVVFLCLFIALGWQSFVVFAEAASGYTIAIYTDAPNIGIVFIVSFSLSICIIFFTIVWLFCVYLLRRYFIRIQFTKRGISTEFDYSENVCSFLGNIHLHEEDSDEEDSKKEENSSSLSNKIKEVNYEITGVFSNKKYYNDTRGELRHRYKNMNNLTKKMHERKSKTEIKENSSSKRVDLSNFYLGFIEQSAIFSNRRVNRDIVEHIGGHFTCILFYIVSMQIIMQASGSSAIVRFWNLFGFIFILYISTYAALFFFFVCRYLNVTAFIIFFGIDRHMKTYFSTTEIGTYAHSYPESNKPTKLLKYLYRRMALFSIASFIFFLLCVIASSIGLIGYIIPYELEVVNGDYSGSIIQYLVSTITVLTVFALTNELWKISWNNNQSYAFITSYYNSEEVQKLLNTEK